MFEGFKKRFITRPGDGPIDRKNQQENRTAAGIFGAAALSGAAAIAAHEALPPMPHGAEPEKAPLPHFVTPEQQQAMQKQGPDGAVVHIDHEAGTATVVMPPSNEKPVDIDLTQKPVDIDPK